ncbi:hypothetical protein GCM10022281_25260 [Sphingomonas rosea]|uniref:Lipoprotein n=1 Tax=Sphingomonas rosea TaxID=335605 RepID=A0ABP7UGN6_9SPHN
MKITVAASLLLAACASPTANPHDRIMDQIEAQVRLPKGAWPLRDYARYYAVDTKDREGLGKKRIVGIYLKPLPPEPSGPGIGCSEVVREDGRDILRDVPCPPETRSKDELAAGERRWLDDTSGIPIIMDGACLMVTVVFDPTTQRVEQAQCNGEA